MSDLVLVDRAGAGGRVAVVTMNRPEVRNAMNPELRAAMSDALKEAEADPEVRVVIVTGAGKAFCAGMDLKAFAAGGDMSALTWFYHEGISKPTIAALNGTAVAGGFELALACDLMVASEDAVVGIPEVKRGLYAAGGGTTLAQRIPLAVALELGLINKVVPADQVLGAAVELAERIAANAPLALAMTKKLIQERRWGTDEETHSVFGSADAREGAVAFAEKRKPAWTGQ